MDVGGISLSLGDGLSSQREQKHQQNDCRRLGWAPLLHHLFNLFNRIHGFIVNLVHIALRVARSITLKLTLIEGTHKLTDSLLIYQTFSESLTYIIM